MAALRVASTPLTIPVFLELRYDINLRRLTDVDAA